MTKIEKEFWAGKKVLITGHTGFKGSWLSLWLQSLGANLHGFAFEPPTEPNLFTIARVGEAMSTTLGDIRNYEEIRRCIVEFRPEIIIHMAAQALVRQSYLEPVKTYATNVMGTVHVLEAARQSNSVQCLLNVTTDKCYENREWAWGYREDEPMGGHDPYSSSKGCAELVSSAYRRSFFQSSGIALATARAGNVIGGGDWAPDRLIPDMLRAFAQGKPAYIRNPDAIRPWQHVLEPLSGYLILLQALWSEKQLFAEAWNFGPNDSDAKPVKWIAERLKDLWGNGAAWRQDNGIQPHESNYLKLDISKARYKLDWQPRWNLETTLAKISCWQKSWLAREDMKSHCMREVCEYIQAN